MRNGFCFDMTACIGCRTCQVACKDKNDGNVQFFAHFDSRIASR